MLGNVKEKPMWIQLLKYAHSWAQYLNYLLNQKRKNEKKTEKLMCITTETIHQMNTVWGHNKEIKKVKKHGNYNNHINTQCVTNLTFMS